MNQRTMLALVALILVGLLLSLIFLKQKKTRSPSRPSVSVLFATKDIPAGTFLQAGDFAWRKLSRNEVLSPDLIVQGTRRDRDIIGSKVLIPLITDQPIKSNMIVAKGVLSPLASVLKSNMRAFTIELSTASALAGLIKPGDIVDIMLTSKKTKDTQTRTILHNIQVIAVDDQILYIGRKETKEKRGSASSKHVTLEVTPNQAELLALSKALGTLSLVLTVPSDTHQPVEEKKQEDQDRVYLFRGERVEIVGES